MQIEEFIHRMTEGTREDLERRLERFSNLLRRVEERRLFESHASRTEALLGREISCGRHSE